MLSCRASLTSFLAAVALTASVCQAQSFSPLAARWSPLGPSLINNAQGASGQRIVSTGRINAVAPNPRNPLGDVWIGSATGGVWHGSPGASWQPMTDDASALAVGDIALDSCSAKRCNTVWVGTGENGIRRDTQYGRGLFKLTANSTGRYKRTVLGEKQFSRGSITRVLLDPRTADNASKTVFVALSSGVTANASQSTVTTNPPSPFGIWRSKNAGKTWSNVLPSPTPATDLEMDPLAPATLFAGLRHQGLFKSTDGGNSWVPIGDGIPPERLASADWPEIAVFRTPGMAQPLLYVEISSCPHPHTKDQNNISCEAAFYKSTDGGASWVETRVTPSSTPVIVYSSYTHALTIHPDNPDVFWFGGLSLAWTVNGGASFVRIAQGLHGDLHEIAVWPDPGSPTGVMAYVVTDGGLSVGDGVTFSTDFQQGLAVTQFQSIAASPGADFLIGGTQDNGTNLWLGTDVWEHIDDGDAGATLIDLDNPGILYDNYFGNQFRRCAQPDQHCGSIWPFIQNGMVLDQNVSWYAPLVQDPTADSGQHPLYAATNLLYRSTNDGASWVLVTPDGPPGGTDPVDELNGIRNPISAVAVSPSNRNRVYIGYYGGQIFTTEDAWAAHPVWTEAHAGLPGRPVTALAVHPTNDQIVLASFSGFGEHSLYATSSAGAAWTPADKSKGNELAHNPVNSLLIEPRFPYPVWAGTDDGVWTGPLPVPGSGSWVRSKGLPNVAVYDLEMAGDGVSILAATHGRGVWRFSATALARVHTVGAEGGPVWVAAAGFDPDQACTLTLLEGDRVCSVSSSDADGAALSTDAQGFLGTARPGASSQRPLAWVRRLPEDADSCAVTEVRVTCGGRTARARVPVSWDSLDPQSTRLSLETAGSGKLTLTAKLRRTDGSDLALCTQSLSYQGGETGEEVLGRASKALAGNLGCRQAGVRSRVAGRADWGEGEDEGPQPFRLSLEAPLQSGDRLVTELTATGTGSFTVDALGSPARGRSIPPRLTLAGSAAGGRLAVTERSPLGTCTVSVETAAGEPAETVAARLHEAFLAPETELDIRREESCLPRQNPRDAERFGAALSFPLGRQVTVSSSDPGLGFTIGAE